MCAVLWYVCDYNFSNAQREVVSLSPLQGANFFRFSRTVIVIIINFSNQPRPCRGFTVRLGVRKRVRACEKLILTMRSQNRYGFVGPKRCR